ncbi:prepilin-type N-terminal cleavage/methylation domain-containing protein [Wenzhouxiangella sediminis]|uniref:Prepilin-type N-terminal cleavage/methylation domain-containing protein n=1 Tax=Wenzhouxiangella sediminis TaxID=1792836 RepID=A0A3E1K4R5_9GAMM|nr:prepilin-type N-terminal cleavage/methylation domain-containing protein [Wenzhouxiangella sediminis]RFF29033.1 prepilin-type N-terminal cleavage/methylation domain-containing protein [Wenzhouxiangella sediminis]
MRAWRRVSGSGSRVGPARRVQEGPGSGSGTPCRRRRQGGFTLIEVLLAIALVSIIMAMAYGGFRASVRATKSGEEVIEQTNRLRVVQQFVRRQLMQSRALIIEQFEDGEIVRFQGDRDHVRFVSPMPGYLSYGGPYVQELSLERGSEGMELVYYYAMLNGYETGALEDTTDGRVLMEDIGDGEFIFLDFDPETGETFWTDLWEEPERLPLAVGVLLDLESDRGLVWPDLIAPVMVDTSQSRARSVRSTRDMMIRQRGAGDSDR